MRTFNEAMQLEEQYQIISFPLKWVFTDKQDKLGKILKHKVRVCVRGDLYRSTRDMYAATLEVSTFRALMSLMVASLWNQYDLMRPMHFFIVNWMK